MNFLMLVLLKSKLFLTNLFIFFTAAEHAVLSFFLGAVIFSAIAVRGFFMQAESGFARYARNSCYWIKYWLHLWYRRIKGVFMFCGRDYVEDFVILTNGYTEIEIIVGQPIESVWISMEECEGLPVCHGHVDTAGVNLGACHFILYAHIHSNVRTIRWRAILQ